MLKLFLLGPPRIELDETSIDIQRRKAIALLIYLAVSEQAHSRDALATLFYPDNTQQRARAYLRRDLAVINTSLGNDRLRVDRDSIELKRDADLWSDVSSFHKCLAAVQDHDHPLENACPDCQAALMKAAALYTDDFLVGFTLRNCPEFDAWQFFQAEGLRQALASTLDRLAHSLDEQHDYEMAIPYARRRLALDPLHEPSHRLLMRLYAASGQEAPALRQYAECVRLLEAEFGVSPEEETTTLYEAIKAKRIVAPLLRAEARRSRTAGEEKRGRPSKPAPLRPLTPPEKITPETPASAPPSRDPQPETPSAIGQNIPLVGREGEYARLVSAMSQASKGHSRVVLIEGESGIGKSRLVEEAVHQVQTQGINVLTGKCYEAERSLPYQVVIHLVDQVLAQWPPETLQGLSPAYLAEIARLVPEVVNYVSDLPPPSDFKEAQQSRLFRALTQFLEILAEPSGLVLVIDDIQWADQITRQFLNHLVYHLAAAPILLVGIYRSEAAATDEALTIVVQAWRQEPYVDHLRLGRLAPDDAKALVQQLLHASPQAAKLSQWLYQETDGHPFFLVSILQSLNERGLLTRTDEAPWPIETDLDQSGAELTLPDALRQSVHSRLRHLPKAAKTVIDLAAVYGRRFDFQMLQAITQTDQIELLDILEDLVARQLWRDVEAGRSYDFSHDKIREVVYHDLSHIRRIILHRQAAEAAEHLSGGAQVGLLAEHFEKGEVWDKAVSYLSQAAKQATKLFAMGEAIDFYDRALNIVEHQPDLVEAQTKFWLYEQRGEARTLAGQLANGIVDLEQVLHYAKTIGDQEWERALLIELGQACRKADRLEQARQYLGQALDVARGAGDNSAVADILYHLGTISFSAGQSYQATQYHQEAVDICKKRGTIDLIAVQAYHGRGEAYFSTGDASEGIKYLEKSLAMARQIEDKSYEAENLQMIGFGYAGFVGSADYDRALTSFKESLAISQKLGLDWLTWASIAGWAHTLGCSGDYAPALTHLEQLIAELEAVQDAPRYLSFAYDLYGDLLRDLNLLDKAEAAHRRGLEVAAEVQVHFWYPRLQANLAIDRLRGGDVAVEDDLMAALTATAKAGAVYHEVRCLEGLAELYLALGNFEAALEYADYLKAVATPGGLREMMAQGHRWRGTALLARQDYDLAEAALQQAADLERQIGRPRLAWDIHAALADLYHQKGDQAAADRQAARVKVIVAKIATPLKRKKWLEGLPK